MGVPLDLRLDFSSCAEICHPVYLLLHYHSCSQEAKKWQERKEVLEVAQKLSENLKLEPGDYVNIAPHQKHKVIHTDAEMKTVWLAVHYS